MKNIIENKEKRFNKKIDIKFRNISSGTTDNNRTVEFYASVFNKKSKMIYENYELFYEVIKENAFDVVLQSTDLNVIATYEHEKKEILGRTKSGTLKLSVDDYGLLATLEIPNTSLGDDILELIKRGDIFECSFVFVVDENEVDIIHDNTDDLPTRYINQIAGLFDVSFVIDGAYSDTDIKLSDNQRSLINSKKEDENYNKLDLLQLDIDLLSVE